MAESGAKLRLKLLINTQTNQVMFAEAGKDFVDFLFSILSLPLAKVISLIHNQGMGGSLTNLYESVGNLNDTYMQPNQSKDNILKPRLAAQRSYSDTLLAINDSPAQKMKFYRCSGYFCSSLCVSNSPLATCPHCYRTMHKAAPFVAPPAQKQASGGFVKDLVTYMVMDDLVVKPLSTISSIHVLNKFNVKDVGLLEEKVVHFGTDEAVKLLKASLETKNVLTSVFHNYNYVKIGDDYVKIEESSTFTTTTT